MTLYLAIMTWRLAWYGFLLLHSFRHGSVHDMATAILLVYLAAVITPASASIQTVAAVLVAPVLTLLLVKYQRAR